MYIDIEGIRTHYIDIGEGSPIVIFQGWGTSIPLYQAMAEHLSLSHRVILPELPGFGRTEEPKEAWDAEEYAFFAARFLKELGISRADMIGHSNGGRIIMKLVTGDFGIKAGRLVLMDSAGIVPERSRKMGIKQSVYKAGKSVLLAAPMKKLFPNGIEALQKRFGSEDYRNASPVMRATLVRLVNEDFRSLMPLIKQPTLLIWGENDTATPLSDGKIMEELIPDAGLVVVEGAGHYSYLEKPAFVYRVLDSFLGGGSK